MVQISFAAENHFWRLPLRNGKITETDDNTNDQVTTMMTTMASSKVTMLVVVMTMMPMTMTMMTKTTTNKAMEEEVLHWKEFT